MKFIITVDTEADNQWRGDSKLSVENIRHIPRFQELCESYGFVPTYLLTYEIIVDPPSAEFFKELYAHGKAEVGLHLHPWSTPPYDDGDVVQRFPSELSDEILEVKMNTLAHIFEEVFGFRAQSFRAGRWGYDDRLGKLLAKHGCVVDTSITPKVDWGNQIKKPERHASTPSFVTETIFPHTRASGIVEVPMTVVYTGPVKEDGYIARVVKYMPYIVRRVFNKLFGKPRWCRIYPETSLEDLIDVYRAVRKNDTGVMVFMIHSSELMVGGSPYTKDDASVERIYRIFEDFLIFLKKEEVESEMLAEYALQKLKQS